MEPTSVKGQSSRQPRVLKWALVFAIAIVANLFINYALSLAYPAPKFEDFCPTSQVVKPVATEAECLAQGGQWNANEYRVSLESAPRLGYCNTTYLCSQEFSKAQSAHDRNVFIILVVAGVILIAASLFSLGNVVLKTSLSLAGSLSLVVASIRYWGEARDWLKVAILGVALVALIALAIKKFSEKIRS